MRVPQVSSKTAMMAGPMSAELKHDLARRHLELFIRGLRQGGAALDGPELGRRELAAMVHGSRSRDEADADADADAVAEDVASTG